MLPVANFRAGLRSGMHSEFCEYVLGVMPSSMGAYAQSCRDVLVRSTFRQEHRYLHLASREPVLQLEVNRARQLGSTVPAPPGWPLNEPIAKGSHFTHRAPDLLENGLAVPA
jgi:hypothetical protein